MSKKLFKSTLVFGSFTLLSRILGLIREVVFASAFGATAGMDAFLVAYKIPNFMRRLFAEGAFSQAFVPVLSEYQTQNDQEELKQLIRHVAGTLAVIVWLVAIIGMLTSGIWIAIFAPGFIHDPHKYSLASQMLRITFPYIAFISLTALSGGILNCYGRFAVPAFTPVLLNISIIAACLCLAPHLSHPVTAAAWGVCIAGFVQFAFQLPFLHRLGVLQWPRWGWRHPGVRKLLKLMIPALFGASVAQLSLLIDTIFASFLKTGSVSWLYYSDRLMQFPLGVFGVALATVVLPQLSRHFSAKNHQGYQDSLTWALQLVVLLAIPATVGLIVLSGPLLMTLFEYGRFNVFDVRMSQESLIAFSVGLTGFIWVKVLVSAYYSRQNMKTPVKVAAIAMLLNLALNALLIWPLAHAGLALATSLASLANGSLLYWGLRRRRLYQPKPGSWLIWLRTIIATSAMAAVLWWLSAPLNTWQHWHSGTRAYHLLLLVCAGAVTYFLLLWLLGIRKRHWFQKD